MVKRETSVPDYDNVEMVKVDDNDDNVQIPTEEDIAEAQEEITQSFEYLEEVNYSGTECSVLRIPILIRLDPNN